MSQEKVDKYKEYKKNKKQILVKEKRKEKLEKVILTLAAIVIVGGIAVGIGFSAKNSYKAKLAARPDYNREEFVLSDMASVLNEETAAVE